MFGSKNILKLTDNHALRLRGCLSRLEFELIFKFRKTNTVETSLNGRIQKITNDLRMLSAIPGGKRKSRVA